MARRLIGLLVHGDAVKGLVRKTNKERKAAPATNPAAAAATEVPRAADKREAGDKGKRKASDSLVSDADADGGAAAAVVNTTGASSTALSAGGSNGNAQTAVAGAVHLKKHKGPRGSAGAESSLTTATAAAAAGPSAAVERRMHAVPPAAPDSDDDFAVTPQQSHRNADTAAKGKGKRKDKRKEQQSAGMSTGTVQAEATGAVCLKKHKGPRGSAGAESSLTTATAAAAAGPSAAVERRMHAVPPAAPDSDDDFAVTPQQSRRNADKGKEQPSAGKGKGKRKEQPSSSETDPDIEDFEVESPLLQRRVVASNKKERIATSTDEFKVTKDSMDPRNGMAGSTPAAFLTGIDRPSASCSGGGGEPQFPTRLSASFTAAEWQTTAAATSSTVNQVNVLGSSTVPNTDAGTGAAAGRVVDVDGDARWSQLPGEHKRRRKLNLSLRRNRPTGSDGIAVAAFGNSVEGRTPSCSTAATALALAPDMAVMHDGAPEPRRGSSQSAVRDGAVDDLVVTTASAMDTTDV